MQRERESFLLELVWCWLSDFRNYYARLNGLLFRVTIF